MRIFGNGKSEFSKIKSKINRKKVYFFAYLAWNLAPLSIYYPNVCIKLFTRDRSLARRIHHDDHALCASAMFYILIILVIPKGKKSVITPNRPRIGL